MPKTAQFSNEIIHLIIVIRKHTDYHATNDFLTRNKVDKDQQLYCYVKIFTEPYPQNCKGQKLCHY